MPESQESLPPNTENESDKTLQNELKDIEALNLQTGTRQLQQREDELSNIPWAEDPENGMNWPFWKKIYHSAVPALLCFAGTFGTSVYSTSIAEVQEQFDVGTTAALLPLAVYVYGLAFGPIIGAPLSEVFGRRFVYIFCFPIALGFTAGAGAAQNYATLLICRLFAGIFVSPPLAVGAGTNMDLWTAKLRARMVSFYLLAPFFGPAVGSIVGGYTVEYKNWRWTQWEILMIGGAIWLFFLGSQETSAKIILEKRAKRLGLPQPHARLNFQALLIQVTTKPIQMLFMEPIVCFYAIYTACDFAFLFCFFTAFPVVFEEVYNFGPGSAGLVFVSIALGCLSATIISIIVDDRVYVERLKNAMASGALHIPPEHRLYSAMIGSVLIPISLFWFAWTARSDIHWICPIISMVFFACGNLLVFISCVLYSTDVYGPKHSSSALAANGLLRYILGGAFPLFTIPMYNKLGSEWATSLLGFISLLLLPVPWVFFYFGPTIRNKSRYSSFNP